MAQIWATFVPCVAKVQLHGVWITHRFGDLGQVSELFGSRLHDDHEFIKAVNGIGHDASVVASLTGAAMAVIQMDRRQGHDALDIAIAVGVCSCHHLVHHFIVEMTKQFFDSPASTARVETMRYGQYQQGSHAAFRMRAGTAWNGYRGVCSL